MQYITNTSVGQIEKLALNRCEDIRLAERKRDSNKNYDLIVQFSNSRLIFENFTTESVEFVPENRITYQPSFSCVFFESPDSFFVIIGTYEIVGLTFETRSARSLLKMNRSWDDDQGFYSENVVSFDSSFIFLYEKGAARIDLKGNLIWENTELFADDVFIGLKEGMLLFSSEYGPFGARGFSISAVDGKVDEA